MLQSLHHLGSPLLDSLQCVCASLVLGSPELDTAPQMWPLPCCAEGKDHLPWPAGNALPNAAQDTICRLCSKGTLLSHAHLGVHQDPQVLFCSAAFQLASPQHVLVPKVIPSLWGRYHKMGLDPQERLRFGHRHWEVQALDTLCGFAVSCKIQDSAGHSQGELLCSWANVPTALCCECWVTCRCCLCFFCFDL